MAFTETFCRSGGSNLNSGGLASGAEPGTSAVYTNTNGGWDSTTGVYTATGNDPAAVTVGDWASVYLDGAAVAVFVGRVTAVSTALDTITVSTTVKSGTAPSTSISGRTIKVGGAWNGPNAAENFPFNFLTSASVNAAGNPVRVNLKNDKTYSISAALANAQNLITFRGYASTAGDPGMAAIDGGANAISLFTPTASTALENLIFSNNGSSGTNAAISSVSAIILRLHNVVIHDIRGAGVSASASVLSLSMEECEVYLCNTADTASSGGVLTSVPTALTNCTIHNNAGSNNNGLVQTGSSLTVLDFTIFDSNGLNGVLTSSSAQLKIDGCDFYSNGRDGVETTGTGAIGLIRNSNFVKNGRYGIEQVASPIRSIFLMNNGYGSGTQANTSGQKSGTSLEEIGAITYAADVTPWVDPDNGDFRINLTAAVNAGRGTFTQTQAGYSGTVGYPDTGAAQHLEPASTTIIASGLNTLLRM